MQFASSNYFCERHKGMGNTFVRCAHKGTRFVTQIQGYYDGKPERGIVDYVEDAPLTVQCIGYFDNPEQAQEYWEEGLALLMADVPVESD